MLAPPPPIIADSLAITVRAAGQPLSMSPSTFATGTRTLSKNTSLKCAAPVAWMSGRTSMPGRSMSTSRNVMPWCFGTSGLVRASSMPWSHHCAAEFHTFWPVTTNSSPSRSARHAESGEVGARARLAEQLAPRVLTREQARHQVALLLLGAERHERGARAS